MGSYFVSSGIKKFFLTLLATMLISINLFFVIDFANNSFGSEYPWTWSIVGVVGLFYVALLGYLIVKIASTTFNIFGSLSKAKLDEYAALINEEEDQTIAVSR